MGASTLKMQSQDDWDIGRKLAARSTGAERSGVPNISDTERIEHKVICTVISGHTHHGIRIGQRERSSIYDIEDLNNQCDEVFIGGTPTEIEFELQLIARAPNNSGICKCCLSVLPAGTSDAPTEQETLLDLEFDASSQEALHFHIASSHFDSHSSYSVEMHWVLRPK